MGKKIFTPSYINLLESGNFEERIYKLNKLLSPCSLCPRKCGVNREEGERGFCKTGKNAIVASYCVHRGEEPSISGTRGSGTIFFARCNLSCLYCQNYEISQEWNNDFGVIEPIELAEIYLELQSMNVHNINLVSPSHIVPMAVEALFLSAKKGFSLPVVYNSNGYDSIETLKLLDGIIDIYMPDFKYFDNGAAKELSNVPDYSVFAKQAIKEMWRQVGKLVLDDNGVAVKGVLVRHLVLPNNLSQSDEVIKYLSEEISPEIALSLMSQYYPAYKARFDERINRPITAKEYQKALEAVDKSEITEGYIQELSSNLHYRPDFSKDGHPFED